ncbi:TPA: JY-1 [Bos taurus]|uniref:Uncharacterized protein n=3 Tax=Bos TaxID=9903 RepID=F1MXL7_BOVIN|nr:TPA: JY-1 [Bos taurus]
MRRQVGRLAVIIVGALVSKLLEVLHRPPRSLLGSPANTQLPDWAQESIDLLPPSCPLRILITVPRLGSLNAIPAPDLCMFSLCH